MTLLSPLADGVNPASHQYSLSGLVLQATRPLPFLVPAAPGPSDVRVDFRPVQLPPPSPDLTQLGRFITLAPDGTAWIQAEDWGRIQVRAGREIIIDAPETVPDAYIHTWLCGTAFAVMCHQRATPTLHACVIAIGGRAVALAGHSGAGKSTLTAALLRRGHQLVVDDQAMIDPVRLTVAPGFPAVKLWGPTATAQGFAVEPTGRMASDRDKYLVRLPDRLVTAPVPLAAVMVLRPDAPGTDPVVEAVPWPESAPLLHEMVHWPAVGRALDCGQAGLARLAPVARHVPISILRRPADLNRLEDLADCIERMAVTRQGGRGGE
jgi:hypothetical protein